MISLASSKTSNFHSKRLTYLIAVIITILLGLASRKFEAQLPDLIAEHAGDALWAMMVYFGFRLLLVDKKIGMSAIFSMLFCFSIECSQLYQENWINNIRNTILGALILGKGFLFIDLMRYTVGILIGTIIDKYIIKKG